MDITEAILERKSIRGFKTDPVPKEVIKEILENSLEAPSAMNSQPWVLNVVAGEALDDIKKSVMEAVKNEVKWEPDIPHKPYAGIFRERQKELSAQLFKLLGIEWEDRARRAEWLHTGFRYYDAPMTIILSKDKTVDDSQATFALGGLCLIICLAALKYGLGTCIADMGIGFPGILRKTLGISESVDIVMCICIGYPDWDLPVNKVKNKCEPFDAVVTWNGC